VAPFTADERGFVQRRVGIQGASPQCCGGSNGKKRNMSTNPSDQVTDQPTSGGGPVDRPNGSIDDDSVHPLTDPDDPAAGNIDPVVPVGNAPTEKSEPAEGQDARLMGPAGN